MIPGKLLSPVANGQSRNKTVTGSPSNRKPSASTPSPKRNVASMSLSRMEKTWIARIRKSLSRGLLSPKYAKMLPYDAHYAAGHCYVATEAAYYLFAAESGFEPHVARLSDGLTHWWLYNAQRNTVLDITEQQFSGGFPYESLGRKQAFLNHGVPSLRALQLMIRVLLMHPKMPRVVIRSMLRKLETS